MRHRTPAMHVHRHSGFTMTELMTALAIVAILTAMAVPTMRSVIENGRIRAASTSVQNGIALARAEAVRRNTRVEFAFTGGGWEVRLVTGGQVLHQADAREVSADGLDISVEPAGADRITYNAFGRVATINPSDDSPAMTLIEIESANPSGSSSYRPLAVQLLEGGTARLCEPHADADEPRACL